MLNVFELGMNLLRLVDDVDHGSLAPTIHLTLDANTKVCAVIY